MLQLRRKSASRQHKWDVRGDRLEDCYLRAFLKVNVPDRDVKTMRALIYYQYAIIIARWAFTAKDGKAAKAQSYGFIKKTFKELQTGTKKWSEITREDWQFVESDKKCSYYGAKDDLHKEHIVPQSLKIKPKCGSCDTIQGIHSQRF